MADYGKLIGAAGDLFGAAGNFLGGRANAAGLAEQASGLAQEGAAYQKAAELEKFNEQYAKAAGDIQLAQQERTNYMVASGTRADWAGAGFADGGSGADILRSNRQQGAMAEQLIGVQSAINQNTYEIQSEAYTAEGNAAFAASRAAEARAGASGGILGTIGSVLQAGASIASFFA